MFVLAGGGDEEEDVGETAAGGAEGDASAGDAEGEDGLSEDR